MAADLAEAATQIAERSDFRAALITGNGSNFTVGGDLGLFAGTQREQLPDRLRRMIDNYHLAIERLTSIDAPVVAAVRGGAGGGGLGLMYVADIVVAADDARFALGYGALGLTADGGNTWFLPRMVGMRRAQELFLLNRRLSAQEALAFGLVSRLVPDYQVESEAASLAAQLAAGPTRAFGPVRRMLRQSFETGLSDQLDAEKDSIRGRFGLLRGYTRGYTGQAGRAGRPYFTGLLRGYSKLAEREGLSGGFLLSAHMPRKAAIAAGYGILNGLHRGLHFVALNPPALTWQRLSLRNISMASSGTMVKNSRQ